MKVYVVWNCQGQREIKICATEALAKYHLKKMICEGAEPTDEDFSDWIWWKEGNVLCFGGKEGFQFKGETKNIAEGAITEYEVLEK